MRTDATFIGIEVEDQYVDNPEIAAKLAEVCPVDIYGDDAGKVQIVQGNVDECVLCRLCIDATPAGAVKVIKLYDNEATLA
jgi:NAD-dependent dihydropyrimidine dehydrogenase PreA subunit